MKSTFSTLPKALTEALLYQEFRPYIVMAGEDALQRLLPIALGNTDQSRVVGTFLLGVFEGENFPFNLTTLRDLELSVFQDCQSVLSMDYQPDPEIHHRVQNGNAIWDELLDLWAPEGTAR